MKPVKYAHQMVRERLRDKILDGDYAIGDKLPTISLIADAFNVSVVTAVKSVKELVDEGILETRRGVGIMVKRLPKQQVSEQKSVLSINISVSTWQQKMRNAVESAMPGWQILETHIDESDPDKYTDEFLDTFIKDHSFPVYVLMHPPKLFQEYFEKKNLPCVVYGSLDEGVNLPNVVTDEHERYYQATRYMLTKYGRVVLLQHQFKSLEERDRYAGVMEALNEGSMTDGLLHPVEIELVGYDEDKSRAVMAEFLKTAPFPLGIICCNDFGAYWLLQEAIAMGISVPDQLGILGEGSMAGLMHTIPKLTCLKYDLSKVGFTLARMLKDVLGKYTDKQQHVKIPFEPPYIIPGDTA